MTTLTPDQWAAVIDAAGDDPSVGAVASALVEADTVGPADLDAAEEAVDSALADGVLTETDAGLFGAVELAARDGDGETNGDCETADTPDTEDDETADTDTAASTWAAVDWHTTETGVYPVAWAERRQWMGHTPGEKQPFAPWGDRDAPADCDDHPTTAAECHCDARWKWGYTGHYATLDDAREWAEKHPKLAGLTYLLLDDDPHAFVDGDDVRCPETGDIHPAFTEALERLGVSYADVSVSGSGIHVVYEGDLPKRVNQVVKDVDSEPWGANDDPPTVEIYDHKHVCVATGQKISDTPTTVRQWDSDGLETLLDGWGELPDEPVSAERSDQFDAEKYDATATSADETATDVRDVFAAIDRLNARHVAEDTICDEWLEPRTAENRCFRPTWARSDYTGTAVYCDRDKFVDTGNRNGYGGPVCMAAVDCPDLTVTDRDCPGAVDGETWWRAVDHLRDLGYDLPEFEPNPEPADRLESTGDDEEDEIREFLAGVIRGD
jgi:hypothetical protein